MELSADLPRPKRLNFDPTINLGHVLTFVGFMATGFMGYSTLDKRITIQEEKTSVAELRQREQAGSVKESLQEIRSDLKEVQRSVNDVNRTLTQQPRKP